MDEKKCKTNLNKGIMYKVMLSITAIIGVLVAIVLNRVVINLAFPESTIFAGLFSVLYFVVIIYWTFRCLMKVFE
jgi:hypothetical protein